MSIHDPSRTYADPVEVVARAIVADIGEQFNATKGVGGVPDAWHSPTGGTIDCTSTARAALEALTKHGFLSMLYFDARNAMKARDGK